MATSTTSTKEKETKGFFARYLDPVDRLAEVIYGILIVMTFTMAFRGIDAAYYLPAGTAATEAVRRLFLAAFGCAVAWGLIDGVMYIVTSLFERAVGQKTVRAVHAAKSEDEAVSVLGDAIDEDLLNALSEEEADKLYRDLYRRNLEKPIEAVSIERDDIFGAVGVFLLAVAATLPVVLPFLVSPDPMVAIRLSNVIAVIMLFLVGFRWAKHVYANPWLIGTYLALIGVVIVMIAIPLGG